MLYLPYSKTVIKTNLGTISYQIKGILAQVKRTRCDYMLAHMSIKTLNK